MQAEGFGGSNCAVRVNTTEKLSGSTQPKQARALARGQSFYHCTKTCATHLQYDAPYGRNLPYKCARPSLCGPSAPLSMYSIGGKQVVCCHDSCICRRMRLSLLAYQGGPRDHQVHVFKRVGSADASASAGPCMDLQRGVAPFWLEPPRQVFPSVILFLTSTL